MYAIIKRFICFYSCTDSGYFEIVEELERNVHIMKLRDFVNDIEQ